MSEKKQNIIFTAVEYFLGTIGLLAILLATLGVITRFVLKISITWSDELLRTVFVWAYFIGTALLYRSSTGLMRLELMELIFKNRGKTVCYKILCIVQDAIICAFSSAIFWYLYNFIMKQIASGETTTTSSTPAWVSPMGFFVGIALLCVFAVEKILKTLFAQEQA